MKKCLNCGAENEESSRFCYNCGAVLDEPAEPEKPTCAVCGAELKKTAKFCPACGARVIKSDKPKMPERCSECGAVVEPGAAFCMNCGKPIGASNAAAPTSRPAASGAAVSPSEKPRSGGFGAVVKGFTAFENKHCVVTNAFIAVLAVVLIIVSLVCPIKVSGSSLTSATENTGGEITEIKTVEIDQNIYQILGSLSYLGLDMSKVGDKAKVKEIYDDYNEAQQKMQKELSQWYSRNEGATDEEIEKKAAELTAKHLKSINYFAYMFAITTVGAMDYLSGEKGTEAQMADMLDTQRTIAIGAVIFATVVSVLQIILAALSLIFLIFAIIGLVKKRNNKILPFFIASLAVSCASVILLSIAPILLPGGAMLAAALTTALMMLVHSTAFAVFTGKNPQAIIKNGICAALSLTAFFLMCSQFLNAKEFVSAEKTEIVTSMTGSLGMTIEAVITFLMMRTIGEVRFRYSSTSVAAAIITLILGIAVIAVLFIAMIMSLKRRATKPEKTAKFDILSCVGAGALLLLAIVPAIIGAADAYPALPAVGTTPVGAIKVSFSIFAYPFVALGFVVANVVFTAVYRMPAAPTDDTPDTDYTKTADNAPIALADEQPASAPAPEEITSAQPETASVGE